MTESKATTGLDPEAGSLQPNGLWSRLGALMLLNAGYDVVRGVSPPE